MDWKQKPQHVIDVTASGKPIHFHYSEGDPAGQKYTPVDHHEAATAHDLRRNRDAQIASDFAKKGLMGASNLYKTRAAHHATQASAHMAKVLPAATKEPKVKPAYVTAQSVYQPKKA